MTHHCPAVVKFDNRDFDHLVAVVPKPTADLSVAGGNLRIAVKAATQAVEIDADPLVGRSVFVA